MQRSALWVGHLVTAVTFVAFLALGIWQYDRSQSATGDFQNLGYALQWPLFAVFAVVAWWRVLVLERRRAERPAAPPPVPAAAPRPRHIPAKQPVQENVQEDETDDDLAAYNRFLARLAARDADG